MSGWLSRSYLTKHQNKTTTEQLQIKKSSQKPIHKWVTSPVLIVLV